MSKINTVIAALLFTLLVSSSAVAQDWTQFRGPNGTGVATTAGLPSEFGPKNSVIWKTELPPRHSSPVLTRDRIYVTAFSKPPTPAAPAATTGAASGAAAKNPAKSERNNHKLFLISLDRKTGKILWQREV